MQRLWLVRPFTIEVKNERVVFTFARAPKDKGYEISMSVKIARDLADELNAIADQIDPQG